MEPINVLGVFSAMKVAGRLLIFVVLNLFATGLMVLPYWVAIEDTVEVASR